jgi:hypothetical protein
MSGTGGMMTKKDEGDEQTTALAFIGTAEPLRAVLDRIDRLEMSADAKALLRDLARITIRVGEVVVAIGRKVVDFAFELIKAFPNTLFGVIVGLIVAALVASVPVIGAMLAPVVVAFGIAKGALEDVKDSGLRGRVADLERAVATVVR